MLKKGIADASRIEEARSLGEDIDHPVLFDLRFAESPVSSLDEVDHLEDRSFRPFYEMETTTVTFD
jgi:hypothetical protein